MANPSTNHRVRAIALLKTLDDIADQSKHSEAEYARFDQVRKSEATSDVRKPGLLRELALSRMESAVLVEHLADLRAAHAALVPQFSCFVAPLESDVYRAIEKARLAAIEAKAVLLRNSGTAPIEANKLASQTPEVSALSALHRSWRPADRPTPDAVVRAALALLDRAEHGKLNS